MRTVDQMYVPPERSEDFKSLQTVINNAMIGMEYSAPISGDNQQIVQMKDLDGDQVPECLLFTKGGEERPLHILIFSQRGEEYVHADTIDVVGTAFEKVEYAQIDGKGGMEIVVGSQVSDRVSRSVSVFSLSGGEAEQLVTADYVNFLTVDLDANNRSELLVLRSGPTETDRGIAELFSVRDGIMERSVEVSMSETADKLKRILIGRLYGGEPAVYVASAVDENTLITDVFTVVDGVFTNVSLSSDSGTSIKTMRNYFIHADDMDNDGIMELPSLMEMRSIDTARRDADNYLIRWYSMTAHGETVDKLYTYHNFIGGWYMQVENELASQLSVVDLGNVCDFYVWTGDRPVKMFSVYTLTGQSRETQSTAEGRFVLHKAESIIYSAKLDDGALLYGITQETVIRNFHLIHEHWKTGEM
jgi:hypothetical protein